MHTKEIKYENGQKCHMETFCGVWRLRAFCWFFTFQAAGPFCFFDKYIQNLLLLVPVIPRISALKGLQRKCPKCHQRGLYISTGLKVVGKFREVGIYFSVNTKCVFFCSLDKNKDMRDVLGTAKSIEKWKKYVRRWKREFRFVCMSSLLFKQ